MFQDSQSLYPEFLAESNIALNQEDDQGQLTYILTPIKQFLQDKQRPFTAYALARASGAPSQLAFFCELASFVGQVLQNLQILSQYNNDYFVSLMPTKDRQDKKALRAIADLSKSQILTMQISFLNQKLEQLRLDSYARYPEVNRFLGYNQFNRVFTLENQVSRNLVSPKTTLAQYLDSIAGAFSYLSVALPALSGISYAVKEQESVLDTQKFQWSLLDSIARNISLLVRTSHKNLLGLFLKEQVTSDKLEWFLLPYTERLELALGDTEVVDQIKQIRTKVYDRTKKDVEYIVLPEKQKKILEQLLNWAYSLSGTNEQLPSV